MRGMDALIALRRRGLRPDQVFIEPANGKADLSKPAANWLSADPGERPAAADLRALLGLTVCVIGQDLIEVFAWADAAAKAGARDVLCKWLDGGSYTRSPVVAYRLHGKNQLEAA